MPARFSAAFPPLVMDWVQVSLGRSLRNAGSVISDGGMCSCEHTAGGVVWRTVVRATSSAPRRRTIVMLCRTKL